jgi:hypothetical protein
MVWEDKFRGWAQSPSQSETERAENAERMIREAISKSNKLQTRDVRVIRQGSYRNRTNVRADSDVDIGVVCYDTFFPIYPEGTNAQTFGNTDAAYVYSQFKDEVGEALRAHFGQSAVTRGNKAFNVRENSYHLEADVAPFFEHRRYAKNGSYISGVELRPDNGKPSRVINWPEQHYESGNAKNDRTKRSYRALVRIVKSLRNEMKDNKIAAAGPIIGFLNECLVWNVPDVEFSHNTYGDDLRAALIHLFNNTKTDDGPCKDWGEVSDLKYLFNSSQKWTRQQAHEFILAAWQYVGFQ